MVKSRKTGGALQTAAGNTPDRGGTPRERRMERLPRRMIERFAPGKAQLHPEQAGRPRIHAALSATNVAASGVIDTTCNRTEAGKNFPAPGPYISSGPIRVYGSQVASCGKTVTMITP